MTETSGAHRRIPAHLQPDAGLSKSISALVLSKNAPESAGVRRNVLLPSSGIRTSTASHVRQKGGAHSTSAPKSHPFDSQSAGGVCNVFE